MTTTPILTFAEWLKIARERAGYNGDRAGKAIGVSKGMISFWENGHRHPSAQQLEALCRVYDADYLWAFAPQDLIDELVDNAELLRKVRASTDRNVLAA